MGQVNRIMYHTPLLNDIFLWKFFVKLTVKNVFILVWTAQFKYHVALLELHMSKQMPFIIGFINSAIHQVAGLPAAGKNCLQTAFL